MKFYDTCALLKKQNNLFDDGRFMISSITLKELESIKTSNSKDEDTKLAARRILFLLDTNPDKYEVSIFQTAFLNKLLTYEVNNDLKILSCALANSYLCDTFVTNDLSLKAIAHSILKGWKIEKKDNYTGYKNISANDEKMAEFYSNPNKNTYNLYINEYINILNPNKDVVDTLVWTGETHRHLNYRNFNSQYFGDVKPWKGDPYQAMVADSFMNNSITVVRGPAGSGKAQPNSTLIPTKNGYIKLGDIKIGDMILDRFGNETKVLAVYPQGLKENYKIIFSDGRVAYCNNEHLWTCYTSKGNFKNFTVQQMLDSGLQTDSGEWRYKIPISSPIEYPEKQFDIDPYVIGAFLGDGCCKESPLTFSSNDEEIVAEIAKLINASEYCKNSEFNYSWVFYFKEKTGIKGNKTRFQTNEFFKNYLLNLVQPTQEKSIPEEYKFGSIRQRYSLIQGLMDTDGTIDSAEKGRTRFTSTSIKLIKDLQEICWSLGMSASISKDNREEKYTSGVCYTLTISCEKENKPNLFRLKRKKDIAIAYANNKIKSIHNNKLTIKAIEKMPHLEEMTCILVDNEEHLYLTE